MSESNLRSSTYAHTSLSEEIQVQKHGILVSDICSKSSILHSASTPWTTPYFSSGALFSSSNKGNSWVRHPNHRTGNGCARSPLTRPRPCPGATHTAGGSLLLRSGPFWSRARFAESAGSGDWSVFSLPKKERTALFYIVPRNYKLKLSIYIYIYMYGQKEFLL